MRGRLNLWLLVLVAVCGVSYWFGKDLLPAREQAAVGNEPDENPAPSYALSEEDSPIHLVVLNGTEEDGLARRISLLLGRAGCVTESVGNAPHRGYAHSLLINRKLSGARAASLARSLGGIRVIREWDGRGGEDAVLVLGRDYAELEEGLADHRAAAGG